MELAQKITPVTANLRKHMADFWRSDFSGKPVARKTHHTLAREYTVQKKDLNGHFLTMHGGRIAHEIDDIGGHAVMEFTGCLCVSSEIYGTFLKPSKEGDALRLEARVVGVEKSRVYVEIAIKNSEPDVTASLIGIGLMVLVVVDESGRPIPIPSRVVESVAAEDNRTTA